MLGVFKYHSGVELSNVRHEDTQGKSALNRTDIKLTRETFKSVLMTRKQIPVITFIRQYNAVNKLLLNHKNDL